MDKFLKDLIKRKEARANELREAIKTAETADEVRRLGDELTGVENELREAQAQLRDYEARNVQTNPVENRFDPSAVLETGRMNQRGNADEDPTNRMEYRKAFMDFVCNGTPIPSELRSDANTTTTDASAAIPTMVVDRIVEKMEHIGMILPLVTQTSFAGGVTVPTSTAKPVATWVAEGNGSDRQKKTLGSISFSYHKLRCEISMSMEVSTMAVPAFERTFVDNVAKAMVKAIEDAIINGNGTGKPKGVLAETAPEGQQINVAKAGKLDYKLLCDAEGAVPEEYENTAVWCMSKKTFMEFQGMVDANGQPVARVNYGINGKTERTLLGRPVVLASAYMPNYQAAPSSAIKFAFIFDFSDYMLNTIYDMGITRKQDWETEDMLTKAVMSVDGKVLSTDSLVVLTKQTT